jgi:2-C-methyl-D-erythritol 4-phosphate cytidylyltransferase
VARHLLRTALEAAERGGYEATDDVGLLERIGLRVHVLEGSRTNIKVTTPADLELAQLFLHREAEA